MSISPFQSSPHYLVFHESIFNCSLNKDSSVFDNREQLDKENDSLGAQLPLGERIRWKRKRDSSLQSSDTDLSKLLQKKKVTSPTILLPQNKDLTSPSKAADGRVFKKLRINNSPNSTIEGSPPQLERLVSSPEKDSFIQIMFQNADIRSRALLADFEGEQERAESSYSEQSVSSSQETVQQNSPQKSSVVGQSESVEAHHDTDELAMGLLDAARYGLASDVAKYYALIQNEIACLQRQIEAGSENAESLKEKHAELKAILDTYGARVDAAGDEEDLHDVDQSVARLEARFVPLEELCRSIHTAMREEQVDLVKADMRLLGIKIRLLQERTASEKDVEKTAESIEILTEMLEEARQWIEKSALQADEEREDSDSISLPPPLEEYEIPPYEDQGIPFPSVNEIPLGSLAEVSHDLFAGIKARNVDLVKDVIDAIKRELRALRKGISLSKNVDQIRELRRNEAQLGEVLRNAVALVCQDSASLPVAEIIFEAAHMGDKIWIVPERQKNALHIAVVEVAARGHLNLLKALLDTFTLRGHRSDLRVYLDAAFQALKNDQFKTLRYLEDNTPLTKKHFNAIQRYVKHIDEKKKKANPDEVYAGFFHLRQSSNFEAD